MGLFSVWIFEFYLKTNNSSKFLRFLENRRLEFKSSAGYSVIMHRAIATRVAPQRWQRKLNSDSNRLGAPLDMTWWLARLDRALLSLCTAWPGGEEPSVHQAIMY